jgi:hypothetical protein
MAITDAERHRLFTKLQLVLGDDDAAVLMSHLPPVGWADVATKADLDHLRAHMDARFEVVDARFGAMETRFEAMETRFEAMEARFDASLERAMREQTNRCLVMVVAAMTILGGVQQLLG